MSAYQVLTLGFYGLLTAFALLATWRSETKRQVGVMLAICWVASNITVMVLPIAFRPSIFPILDVLFALTAAKAGKETGSKIPLILIGLSAGAVAANTAFSISGAGYYHQVHSYEIVLNAIFALQCIVTGAWGVADVLGGIMRQRGIPRYRWGHSQSFGHSDRTP